MKTPVLPIAREQEHNPLCSTIVTTPCISHQELLSTRTFQAF